MVELWWYWGTGWKDPSWILWRAPKTKIAYKEWVSVDDLVCDEFNHIVRITMESVAKRFHQDKFKLSKDSIKDIKRCLDANKAILDCMVDGVGAECGQEDESEQSE